MEKLVELEKKDLTKVTRASVLENVCNLIMDEAPELEFSPDDELQLDSLKTLDVAHFLEYSYDLQISDNELGKFKNCTANSITNYVVEALQKKGYKIK